MSDTLTSIVEDMLPTDASTVIVDVSPFFKNAVVLTWKRPSVAEVYRIAKDARQLLNMNPLWDEQLAVHVATVAACHQAPIPGTMPVGVFYAQIANAENDRCWLYLQAKLKEEFGYLLTAVDSETLKKILAERGSSNSASVISADDTP